MVTSSLKSAPSILVTRGSQAECFHPSSFSPIVPAGGKGVYNRDKADVSAKDELCPEGNRAGTVLKP